jgi:curved DNA-binding protein
MAVSSPDFYEVLGVGRDASEEEIRSAYRRLARQNHPDVNKDPDASRRFSEISEAYEVLRDPEQRAQYDRFGPNWRAASAAGAGGPGPRGGGTRGGGGGGAGGGFEGFGGWDDDGGVHVDFGDLGGDDLFEQLFGRGRGRGRAGGGFSARGSDQETVVELSLEDAYRGGKQRVRLSDGRDYEVTVPPGVREGQRIRLAGQGAPGARGGPAGDLFLRVRLKAHPRFRLVGSDLEVDLAVAPWEAALGASVPVPTLEGEATVRVPAGSSSGRRLRLRAQGWPKSDGGRGDLYAVVKIVVPRKLSDEERRLYERLAEVSDFDPRRRR